MEKHLEEFDAVAKNAAQLNDIYNTPTTNALIVAVAALREKLERAGVICREGELRSLVEMGEMDRW